FGNYNTLYPSPVVSGDTVYAAGAYCGLFAVNRHTGRIIWQYLPAVYLQNLTPVIAEGRVCIPLSSKTVIAISQMTGELKWTSPVANYDITSQVTYCDGKVYYISSDDNYVYLNSVNCNDGSSVWVYKGPQGMHRATLPIFKDSVNGTNVAIVRGGNGRLIAVLLTPVGAIKRWEVTLPNTNYFAQMLVSITDGLLYVGSCGHDGIFYAVDIYTGKIKWRYGYPGASEEPYPYIFGAAAVANGRILFRSQYGNVYCLESAAGQIKTDLIDLSTGFSAFPNPFSDKIFFAVPGTDNQVQCRLYDLRGRVVYSYNGRNKNRILVISTGKELIIPGKYILKISSGGENSTYKITTVR
ncbi:MAG: PQQ-binding-like beta-propeller repeat protein, partial [bacterium]